MTADEQTDGLGRRGREWVSFPHCNLHITFSFFLPNHHEIERIGQLLALSTAHTLKETRLPISLKWPNDLRIRGKKLAGILCETIPQEEQVAVLAGIGINVNATREQLSKIDQPATSLLVEIGKPQDQSALLERLIGVFQADLGQFVAQGFGPFESALRDLLEEA